MSVASIYLNDRQFKPEIVSTTYQVTSDNWLSLGYGQLELSNGVLFAGSVTFGNYSKGDKVTVYGRAGECYAFTNGEADNSRRGATDVSWMPEESYQLLVKNSIIVSGGVINPTIYLLPCESEVAV